MTRLLLLALLALAAFPARAQDFALGAAAAPQGGKKDAKERKRAATPMALAISLSFPAGVWEKVGVSTASAPVDLTGHLRRGLYRLELLQLVLLAERSGAALGELVTARVGKEKKSLRELAEARGADFDALYEEALAKGREVDRRVEQVERVTALPGSSP